MGTKKLFKPVLIIFTLFLMFSVNVGVAFADESSEDALTILSANEYDEVDAEWLITDSITYDYVDEQGTLHHRETIWREPPAGYILPQEFSSPCEEETAAGCTYIGAISVSDADSISTNGKTVTAYVKNYADKYCEGGCSNRVLYKMTQVDLSWSRTSTNWTVKNAALQWGCSGACTECDNDVFNYVYPWNTSTIGWTNNTQSLVYIFKTQTLFPALQPLFDDAARAISTSKPYYSGISKGTLTAVAGYP